MIYQNDLTDPQARSTGCYVRSLLRVPEIYTVDFTKEELDSLFEICISHGYCDKEYTVKDPARIVKEGFLWRDQERDCFQTAIKDLKGERWWSFTERDPAYRKTAFMILKGQTVRHHAHFRLGDNMGLEVFDPYYPKPLIQYEIYRTYYYLGEAS